MTYSTTDHEFYPVWLRRKDVEEDIQRSLTDDEWFALLEKVGKELDDADAQVIDKAIKSLESN